MAEVTHGNKGVLHKALLATAEETAKSSIYVWLQEFLCVSVLMVAQTRYPFPLISAEINAIEILEFSPSNSNTYPDGSIVKRCFMAIKPLHSRL